MLGRTTPKDRASVREVVEASVPDILDQAQVSTANHQKNLVALYKVQQQAAECFEKVRRGRGYKLVGERVFEEFIMKMIMRVLPVKKGTSQADRVVRFFGAYVKFINEKAVECKGEGVKEDDEEPMAARFTARLLKFLLKGFNAKDRSIRYRVLHTVSEMVAHLGEIDEEVYKELRQALVERIADKETNVRVQAVIAFSKLSGAEDPSDLAEGEQGANDILCETLAHDSSPEVRRAALLNLPVNPQTLSCILERTRDTDTTIRKFVYNNVLMSNVVIQDTGIIGPTHPRAMSIAQRELIIRNGLGDREQSVRNAAAALLTRWVEAICENVKKEEDESNGKPKIETGLVDLLKLLDLVESEVAVEAVLSVFTTKPDIFDNMEFDDSYWSNLTLERAFLARVFVEHCKATKDEVRLEAALPVVTELAFRIQEAYNKLTEFVQRGEEIRIVQDLDEDAKSKFDDERLGREFVIGEMLKLAINLDYSDEIGRRKMFQLVRDMLSREELPESFLCKCLDVLRQLSPNERDLIRVVVEIVQDLRDFGDDSEQENGNADADTTFEETPTTARPTRRQNNLYSAERSTMQQERADFVDLRCLSLCIGMLERVNGKLEENSSLEGIVSTLILPSVARKELTFREKGLISLGLICLIDRRTAFRFLNLFWKEVAQSPEVLKIGLLHIIFDMLMVHEHDLLSKDAGDNSGNIITYLRSILDAETSTKVSALLCIGLSKLVLSGMITNLGVVHDLAMIYLQPCTAENLELRQCLTFFLSVYSHSSPGNQSSMREIFIETFIELNNIRKNLDDDEEMVSSKQVGEMFVEWTDPQKLKSALEAAKKIDNTYKADDFVHLELASDIFKAILGLVKKSKQPKEYIVLEREDTKVLCQLLSKLHIPDTVDDYQVGKIKSLIEKIRSHRPIRDSVAIGAFNKFDRTLSQKFEKQLERLTEDELRKLEQLNRLFDELDEIIPLEENDDETFVYQKKGKKRRSTSVVTNTSEETDVSRHGRSRSKRPRLSTDYESDDSLMETSAPLKVVVPKRTLPTRASRKPAQIIDIDSGSEDDTLTPRPRSAKIQGGQKLEQISTEIPFDSIMDDSQDEEEEVNMDLLIEDQDY